MQVFRGASLKPGGDIVSALISNSELFSVMRMLEAGGSPRVGSMRLDEPSAVYNRDGQQALQVEAVESIWEESELFIQKTSRIDSNFILLSLFSGLLSATGLAADQVYLVIAALLLVPGFEPIANIPLGVVLRSARLIKLGLKSSMAGYALVAASSIAAYYALLAGGMIHPPPFEEHPLVEKYITFNAAAAIAAVIGAAAGITVIPTHRSVLTAGAMVALALVPGASIFGIGMAIGHWDLALRGLGQWAMCYAAVIVTGLIIFALKNLFIHKRGAWF